jgi:hypothetical protein
LVHFPPVLVCFAEKNLATLRRTCIQTFIVTSLARSEAGAPSSPLPRNGAG